ncbi:MAG TPA: hypothetical protein VL242_53795 [Sorangium sp.]|nr:hypothetical protein [Sorangium sp.]
MKKTELARQMLDVFVSWVGTRRVELAADSAYCNATVIRGQPSSVTVFGAMRPDGVLTSLPTPREPGTVGVDILDSVSDSEHLKKRQTQAPLPRYSRAETRRLRGETRV